MKSLCAANSGAVLVSVACSVSLVLAPLTALKARLARSSSSARTLHRDEGIVEGRRGRVVGDRGHFALLLGHPGEQRGQIVAVLDLREIGRLERQGARLRERVGRRQASRTRARLARRGSGRGRSVATASAAVARSRLRIMCSPRVISNSVWRLSNRRAPYASLNISRWSKGRRASPLHSAGAWPRQRPARCANSLRSRGFIAAISRSVESWKTT